MLSSLVNICASLLRSRNATHPRPRYGTPYKIFIDLDISDFGFLLDSRLFFRAAVLFNILFAMHSACVYDPLSQSGPRLTDPLDSLKHQPGAYLPSPSRALTDTAKRSTDFVRFWWTRRIQVCFAL